MARHHDQRRQKPAKEALQRGLGGDALAIELQHGRQLRDLLDHRLEERVGLRQALVHDRHLAAQLEQRHAGERVVDGRDGDVAEGHARLDERGRLLRVAALHQTVCPHRQRRRRGYQVVLHNVQVKERRAAVHQHVQLLLEVTAEVNLVHEARDDGADLPPLVLHGQRVEPIVQRAGHVQHRVDHHRVARVPVRLRERVHELLAQGGLPLRREQVHQLHEALRRDDVAQLRAAAAGLRLGRAAGEKLHDAFQGRHACFWEFGAPGWRELVDIGGRRRSFHGLVQVAHDVPQQHRHLTLRVVAHQQLRVRRGAARESHRVFHARDDSPGFVQEPHALRLGRRELHE
mmetsp:Transcript_61803/g.149629  ORF Transcript_61803/g.149629 Transcript_61803/m.149629 type:complete len:345 (-) Transcript_61803:54-1088(-)